MSDKEQAHGLPRRKKLEILKGLRLLDDIFFTKCFEGNNTCIELVLRIILNNPTIKVADVHTQNHIEKILHRSVCLDVFARNAQDNTVYDVEIQRSDVGANARRARHNSAMLDSALLDKGDSVQNLPDAYVIFITENDFFGKGLPIYHVRRYVEELYTPFEDGSEIIYVNGSYYGDSNIGKLMHDFRSTDPNEMYFNVLSDRVRYFKEEPKGVRIMSKAMEELYYEAAKEGAKANAIETARFLLTTQNFSDELAAKATKLSLEEIGEIRKELNSCNA